MYIYIKQQKLCEIPVALKIVLYKNISSIDISSHHFYKREISYTRIKGILWMWNKVR